MGRPRRWTGIIATVVLAGCTAAGGKTADPPEVTPGPTTTTSTTLATTTTADSTTTSEDTTTTSTTLDTTTSTSAAATFPAGGGGPIKRTLSVGSKGTDVKMVQQRLIDLKFDPGPADGRYGYALQESVWAYQRLIGLTGKQVTGTVSPTLWATMSGPFTIAPKDHRSTVNHVEVDLPTQTAVLWYGSTPRLIIHISSGSNRAWCEHDKGICGVAVTPGGTYKFGRRYAGWRESDLGKLYNPVYFNYGIAMHGALEVPNYPASHGCIRMPMHIAEYFPTLVKTGDEVLVYDGTADPRTQGSPPPPFNTPDPDSTATTTTVKKPTPSTTSTTAAPGTTVKPPTTSSPSTTVATTSTSAAATTTTAA